MAVKTEELISGIVSRLEKQLISGKLSTKFSPVIYLIKNTKTNKSYIGRTRQEFFKRWLQHFRDMDEIKFHKEITKDNICDWSFRILCIMDCSVTDKEMSKKEQHYIKKYDSITNGYNDRNETKA